MATNDFIDVRRIELKALERHHPGGLQIPIE